MKAIYIITAAKLLGLKKSSYLSFDRRVYQIGSSIIVYGIRWPITLSLIRYE